MLSHLQQCTWGGNEEMTARNLHGHVVAMAAWALLFDRFDTQQLRQQVGGQSLRGKSSKSSFNNIHPETTAYRFVQTEMNV
jgi:hypothetical protein